MHPLDAVKSLVDFNFYRTVPRRSYGEASLYLAMLSLIFATAMIFALMFQVVPQIRTTLNWARDSFPTMTLTEGTLTSDAKGPVVVRHPELKHVSIVVDTNRVEPVTVEELQENGALAILTRNKVYIAKLRPILESRSKESVPGFAIDGVETHILDTYAKDESLILDSDFYDNISRKLPLVLYPVAFIFTFGFFFIWKHGAAVVYSLMGLLINGFQTGRLEFPALYRIAVFVQTPVVILQIAALFIPEPIRLFGLITLIVVGVYLWKAIAIVNADLPEPPEPSPLPE